MDLLGLSIAAQLPIGIEWIILLAVVAIILLLGPRKIPELARGIGKALGEFRRGRAEIEREIQSEVATPPPAGPQQVYEINPRVVEAAKQLGIDVVGRKERDLKVEILSSMKDASRKGLESVARAMEIAPEGLDDDQLRDKIAEALGI